MDTTTQIITTLVIVLALVITIVATQFARRRPSLPLRAIPAYETLPLMVGESIEADRPVHVSLGGAGLGGATTPLTLANIEFFYETALRTATGAVAPILTTSEAAVLPLADATLRRALAARNRLDINRAGRLRWYPSGTRALSFAAALTGTLGDDRVSSSILIGSFGPELALVLDAAHRRRQTTIASSDQLAGQAIAYVMSDRPLLGEEVFAAPAYLGESAGWRAGVVAIDSLRWTLIIAILIPTIIVVGDLISQPPGAVTRFLSGLLGSILGGGN